MQCVTYIDFVLKQPHRCQPFHFW